MAVRYMVSYGASGLPQLAIFSFNNTLSRSNVSMGFSNALTTVALLASTVFVKALSISRSHFEYFVQTVLFAVAVYHPFDAKVI